MVIELCNLKTDKWTTVDALQVISHNLLFHAFLSYDKRKCIITSFSTHLKSWQMKEF